ncbi:MAG: hypothetical protein U9N82_11380 [Thermodesulfobacteriota bacterium]|nr:hypothetical protein [Thermodesulfobacteriota bacterium]
MKNSLIIIILAAVLFSIMNFHFILSDKGLSVLKKTKLTFDSTFVDARGAEQYKLFTNPALVEAGIKKLLKEKGITID